MGEDSQSLEGKAKIVAELLIPPLDNPNWKEKYSPSQEAVEKAQAALGKEYSEIGWPAAKKTFLLILLIGLLDYAISLDPIVYGLAVNISGAVFLFYPSIRGRYTVATLADGENSTAKREIQVRQMAFSNVGFCLLGLGFLLQLFAVQLVGEGGLIIVNALSHVVPEWSTPMLVLVACYLAFRF